MDSSLKAVLIGVIALAFVGQGLCKNEVKARFKVKARVKGLENHVCLTGSYIVEGFLSYTYAFSTIS